jgi:D-amino peptidase
MMAEDANAAIRGAVDGGATEVVVIDSHGSGHNLQREDLDAPARLISENFRRHGMMEGLDATFDAVFLIGHHAKAGSPVGVMAHTQNGNIRDVQINGRSVGEGGMNTLYAAWHGVPVVMVTGDQVAVAQIQEVATGALGVSVKRAINARAVELRVPDDAREEIRRTAAQAVRTARKLTERPTGPFRIQIWYRDTAIPEVAEAIPGIERPSPDSLAFSADTLPAAYALYRVLYRHIDGR